MPKRAKSAKICTMNRAGSGTVVALRGPFQPARLGLLGALGLVLIALGAAPSGQADPIAGLKQEAAGLHAEERAVLLQLYGLDSQLDSARAHLALVQTRLASLRVKQGSARSQLRIARRTLRQAQARLGRTLVALYETGTEDPIAVIFGATSFVDALDGLDNLTQIASSHAAVASEARRARRRIAV